MILNENQVGSLTQTMKSAIGNWPSLHLLGKAVDDKVNKYNVLQASAIDIAEDSITADVAEVNGLIAAFKTEAAGVTDIAVDLTVLAAIEAPAAPAAEESSEEESE